ncbi:hypothetical protein MMC21_006565 [Puttea exsequens]|nr:hypothetical protein [Puttea exsequens]
MLSRPALTVTLTALLSLTAASPVQQLFNKRDATSPFTLIASKSGSPFHLQAVNANGGAFWIGKEPNTICPSGLLSPCSEITSTVLVLDAGGNGYLDIGGAGGQDLYMCTKGALSFTLPHEAGTQNGVTGSFTYTNNTAGAEGDFRFAVSGTALPWLACPSANNGPQEYQGIFPVPPYQVYAAIPELADADVLGGNLSACIGFDALGSTYDVTKGLAYNYE